MQPDVGQQRPGGLVAEPLVGQFVDDEALVVPVFGEVVGAEGGNAILVTITLKDANGVALAAAAKATVWLSDTAGAAPSAVAPSGGTAITTGVALKEHTADVLIDAVSNAAGVIGVTITEAGAKSYFVNVAIGNVVASSGAATFA